MRKTLAAHPLVLFLVVGVFSVQAKENDVTAMLSEIKRQITWEERERARLVDESLSIERAYAQHVSFYMKSSTDYYKEKIAETEKEITEFQEEGIRVLADKEAEFEKLPDESRDPERLQKTLTMIRDYTASGVQRMQGRIQEYRKNQSEFDAMTVKYSTRLANIDQDLASTEKKISVLRQRYDDLYLVQEMQQSPMTIDGYDVPTYHPPYLQNVVVSNISGEIFYSAAWTGPESVNNKELVIASNELLKMKAYRTERVKKIDYVESEFINATERYVETLNRWSGDVKARVATNTVISTIGSIIKSKGNVVSLGVDAIQKWAATGWYLKNGNTPLVNFQVKIPNYPDELLELMESTPEDPVKWANKELKKTGEYSLSTPNRGALDAGLDEDAALSVAQDLLMWGIKKLAKTGGGEYAKEWLRNGAADWFVRRQALEQLKATTLASQGRSAGIDLITTALKEFLDNTDERFIRAGWIQIEWFALRQQYHFEYAKLRETDRLFEKAIKEFDALYESSLKKPDQRQLRNPIDEALKTGDYLLSLTFSHEVHIRGLSLDGRDFVDRLGRVFSLDIDENRMRPKYNSQGSTSVEYQTQYDIHFHYENSSNSSGLDHSDAYRIPLVVAAADRESRMLDGDPSSVPIYHPKIIYHPQSNGEPSKKVFESIHDDWVNYDSDGSVRFPKPDEKHKLRRLKPIELKATLKGAEPTSVEVR